MSRFRSLWYVKPSLYGHKNSTVSFTRLKFFPLQLNIPGYGSCNMKPSYQNFLQLFVQLECSRCYDIYDLSLFQQITAKSSDSRKRKEDDQKKLDLAKQLELVRKYLFMEIFFSIVFFCGIFIRIEKIIVLLSVVLLSVDCFQGVYV